MGLLPNLLPESGSFERMTALDASFLHAETDRTPLHIGSLSVFEGAPFFDEKGRFRLDDVCTRVTERLHLLPRFRKRVATVPFGQGRPVWVDDEHFDITNHVKLMVLSNSGSRAELASLCSYLYMQRLDRSHPLWELWFIGGLDDGNVAMVEKVHHAMIDGVSGVDVAAALLDLEPSVGPIAAPPWTPTAGPGDLPLLFESVRDRLVEPVEWTRTMRALLRGSTEMANRLGGLATGLRTLRGGQPSHLTQKVGTRRELTSVEVPLDPVRDAAHRRGATINDIVLAAITGGLRELLASRGDDADHLEVRALIPVSMRHEDQHGRLGNQVSGFIEALPLFEPTPEGRLQRIREAMAEHKRNHEAEGTELLVEGLELVPPALLAMVTKVVHRQPFIDIVTTNVPGPSCPLYFMGARMLEAIPIVPLAGNLSIGIAILSYAGRLTIGIFADRDLWPDLSVLTDGIRAGFDVYTALADAS